MRVSQLFRQHEQYKDMTYLDEYNHLHLPQAHDRLVLYKGVQNDTHIAFTWTRPTTGYSIEKLMAGKADEALWQDHTTDMKYAPWIVDVAASPGISGYEIGTFLREVSILEGIAYAGQRVLFHRSGGINAGRIGFFTARGL